MSFEHFTCSAFYISNILFLQVGLSRYEDFFGTTAWPIILNITLPLVVFYRFHSSVCMADMWSGCYEREKGPNYQII